jgi:invasion protein IalB
MPNIGLPQPRRGALAIPGLLVALLLAAPAVPAEAPRQGAGDLAAAPAAPPVAQVPRPMRYDDWLLGCDGGCGIATTVRGEGGAGPEVLRLGVEGAAEARFLVVETPLQLYLPDGLSVTLGDGEPRVVPWRTCDREGCEARATLDPDLLAALRRERRADLGFTLIDGSRVRLQASLIGFTAAERALGGEPVPEVGR